MFAFLDRVPRRLVSPYHYPRSFPRGGKGPGTEFVEYRPGTARKAGNPALPSRLEVVPVLPVRPQIPLGPSPSPVASASDRRKCSAVTEEETADEFVRDTDDTDSGGLEP
jgi:hypothetical protein